MGSKSMTALVSEPVPSPMSESELVEAAAAGDTSAFAELYQQYSQKAYNLALRSVRDAQAAEDVCQEAWLKVYRELRRLREPAAFATWLYRIVARACVDRARRSSPGRETELPEDLRASSLSDPEETAIKREQGRLAWEALGALPTRQHLSLFLREVEGRNYREIAEIMNTSESAVETLLFRARRGLAEAYERFHAAMPERCGHAQRAMAGLMDGETTPVQRRALAAHVDDCRACRGQLGQMQRASAAYAALPLIPVPALLAQRVLEQIGSIGSATISGGTGTGLAKLVSLAAAQSKLIATTLTLTGGLTMGALLAPSDSMNPVGMPTASQGAQSAREQPAAFDAADVSPGADQPASGLLPGASLLTDVRDKLNALESQLPLAAPALDQAIEDALDAVPLDVVPLDAAQTAVQEAAQTGQQVAETGQDAANGLRDGADLTGLPPSLDGVPTPTAQEVAEALEGLPAPPVPSVPSLP